MERPSPTDMLPKREQRDMELDKRIEALRRKNQALMKRYQEVEEDKKKAEEEGKALQSRKGKAEDLTITINKSAAEGRVVVTKPGTGEGGDPGEQQDRGLGCGRGRRRQLLVTMAGNHTKGEKRVVSERTDRKPGPHSPLDVTKPAEERHSGGRAKHPHRRDPAAQDEERQVQRRMKESYWLSEGEPNYQDAEGSGQPPALTDLTIPTSEEEQEEYLRWKKEREQIDRERVARHKNAKGQWRRAWDMDKTDHMFSDKPLGERDRGAPTRGGKGARKGYPKPHTDSRGHQTRAKGDKGGKDVPVVSSTAKGKDRLTGRARRWDADEEGEHLQGSEKSLEEFLEELDAMGDPDVDDPAAEASEVIEGDLKMESSPILDVLNEEEEEEEEEKEVRVISDVGSEELTELSSTPPARASQEKTEASSPKGPEKKVRFSDDLIKGSHETHTVGDQNSACLETKGDSSFKNTSSSTVSQKLEERQHAPIDTQGAGSTQDQVDIHAGDAQPQSSSTRPGQQLQAPEVSTAFKTECAESRQHDNVVTPSSSSHMEEKASGPQQENSVQLLEHTKSNSNSNRNTEELLDSSLSVLNMEEETCPALTTSTDKARENGKIV